MIFWFIFRGFLLMPSYAWWVTPQSSAKLNVLWSYITAAILISVTFVTVKLQIFKSFRSDTASMSGPFWGYFAMPFPNMAQFGWHFDKRKSLTEQIQFLNIFKNFVFKQKRDIPKVYSVGQFLGPMLVKEFLL